MSSSALTWAFAQRLSTSAQQALLHVLADHADPSGLARQCQAEHLAEGSRLSRANLLKCLSALRSAGAIETAEKITEDGSRTFDVQLLLQKSVALHRSDKPSDPPRPVATAYDLKSPEGRAIILLHEIAELSDYLRKVMIRNGVVHYLRPVDPRLISLTLAGPKDAWPVLTRRQAGSWEKMLRETITVQVRKRLREGDRAPWSFAPSLAGKIYPPGIDPPADLMTEQDEQDAANFR
jgi:hypothetical protein